MKKILVSLVLASMILPSVASANSFTCKEIWPDNKFPKVKTFYICRDLSDIKTASPEKQEFWKWY